MKDLFFDYGALDLKRAFARHGSSRQVRYYTMQSKIPHILICGCANLWRRPVASDEGRKDLTHPPRASAYDL